MTWKNKTEILDFLPEYLNVHQTADHPVTEENGMSHGSLKTDSGTKRLYTKYPEGELTDTLSCICNTNKDSH